MMMCSQRYGSFNPSHLGAQLVGWWDSQDLTTLFTAPNELTPTPPGGLVGRWKDKSGHNAHADQLIDGNKPTRDDAGINGNTALSFTGSQRLETPALATNLAQAEFWMVGRCLVPFGPAIMFETSPVFFVPGSISLISFPPLDMGFYGYGDVGYTSCSGPNTVNPCLCHGTIDFSLPTNEANLSIDGVPTNTRAFNNNNGGLMTNQIGYFGGRSDNTFFLTGFEGEGVLINGALSPAHTAQLTAYFMHKWGMV